MLQHGLSYPIVLIFQETSFCLAPRKECKLEQHKIIKMQQQIGFNFKATAKATVRLSLVSIQFFFF